MRARVRLADKAAKMAALAAPKDIPFSVHAPYYISMSGLEEDKRLNSIQYLGAERGGAGRWAENASLPFRQLRQAGAGSGPEKR